MSKWRLKQIEIENFKSYRGKQIIGPFKKFTAIVGPNGSGKSNLMDCISFVLGEQTRNLRVRRLNDLIHGAVVGRPVARSAYVRAVIENVKNGEEISYTRLVHNNSSEYKINGQSVKVEQYAAELEKIHIFMKVKNFLVFQGAVESIAMKNAKERCQMFEEISKSVDLKDDYDQAKADMLKAEEETAFNYHKKKGIAAERREAKMEKDEAERYKKLKKDLVDRQLDLQLFRLYYNEQELKNLAESLRERQSQLDAEQRAKRGVEDEMKDKRKDQTKLQREQTSLIQEIKQCEVKMSKKKPELLRIQQRLKHLSDKHGDSKKSLSNAKQAHETHLNEIDQLEGELSRIETLQEEYETQQNQASQAQGKSLDLEESQVKRYHLLKQKVAERTSHISAIVDNLTREYDEQKDAYEALERKKQEIVSSQRRKENELAETKKRHQKLCEYIESSTKAIQEQKKLETQIRVDVEEATKRIEEINGELESVVTQLGEAKVERHESSRAAKKQELIENLRRLFPGVYGRLIEMCEPSHRRYQVAITKVLGKYMEAIVCDSEKTAKDCIQYMKDQRIDPETFLPLDYLDIRPIDERLREIRDPPNVHLVIDVLQYDPPIIRKALQFACGNALVCETVEDARRVAYRTGERKKTVSLDGTLFQKSGVISGGATDLKARARRWDEKQINSLMAKREKLQEELKEALKKKRKEAELRTIQSQIKGLETRLKYTQKDKDSTEGKLLGTNEEEITNMREELENVETKASRCQTRMQELQIVINDEKSKMDNVEDEVFGEFCKQIGVSNIREYEERELRIARDRDRKRLEFQNQLQRIKNQLEYEKSRDTEANVRKWTKALEDEKTESEKSKKQERRIKDDIESEEVKKNDLEDNLAALKRRSEKVDTELAEIRTRLAARQKDIQKVQKELNQVETRLENRQAERHSLLQTAKMEDIKLPFKRGSMEDIEDVAGDTENSGAQGDTQDTQRIYEREAQLVLDYRRYLEKPLRSLDNEKEITRVAERMQTECDQMSLQLHRISAPNLRASDKLGTVEERLRSTEVEFDDARRRARKTKAHFEKIKRMRHERFMDCFNIVADHIDPIYKMLARNAGAQASLLPTNPEEPYLEEIQFQCVAPGKRFQQMDSLSGGEKTIAALALLFATHSYNSAPFFVLDEIDAALDNTNIGKVAAFIREYAEDRAQVIVISLKEEFYSRADSLVGIYPVFDDSCLISNVLSLDLTNYPDPTETES